MCVCVSIVEAKVSNRWSFIIYKFTSDFSTQHRQIENFSHINSLNNLMIRDDWIVAIAATCYSTSIALEEFLIQKLAKNIINTTI